MTDKPKPDPQENKSDFDSVNQDLIEDKEKGNQGKLIDSIVSISTIAWTIVACIAIGVFLGYWADKKLHSQPLFSVIFSLLGIISAIYFVFNFSINSNKRSQDK